MLKYVTLGSAATIATAKPASAFWINHADGTYTYVPDSLIFVLMFVGAVVGLGYVLFEVLSAPPPPKKTADEYNADAVLLAARRHHIEMETELRKAEIEAARVNAMHQETSEIIKHDRKVRDLNAKLDEQRRAS
jgi:hypothetical protein